MEEKGKETREKMMWFLTREDRELSLDREETVVYRTISVYKDKGEIPC